jgi:Tol biopolymer transport system component
MSVISATKDGKRLAFLQWSGHATLYVADLKASGTRMDHERHLTLSESSDFFGDWTPDSKSIVFWSNRDGQNAIYRRRLDDDTPQLLVTSKDQLGVGCVSPDGKWSIYFLAKESKDPRQQAQLMRVPLAGGTSQTILTTNGLEGWDCAKDPQGPCLLEERSDDRKQAVITAFDPLKGRGAELARIALDPQVDSWVLALSPNGKRLAVIRSPGSPLEILSLKGELLQQIKIPEWSNSGPVKWAADGKGLFVPSTADGEASLIYVNLRGDVHVLRRNREGDYSTGAPSPDGKHIAIVGTAQSRNFWMMEKF